MLCLSLCTQRTKREYVQRHGTLHSFSLANSETCRRWGRGTVFCKVTSKSCSRRCMSHTHKDKRNLVNKLYLPLQSERPQLKVPKATRVSYKLPPMGRTRAITTRVMERHKFAFDAPEWCSIKGVVGWSSVKHTV